MTLKHQGKKTHIKQVREAEAQSHHKLHSCHGHQQSRENSQTQLSPWGAKSLNPASGVPTLKTWSWQTIPPNLHLALKANGACIHKTHKITKKQFLKCLHTWTHLTQGPAQRKLTEKETFCERDLFAYIKGEIKTSDWRTGIYWAHIWDPTIIVTKDGSWWVTSLCSPSASLQLTGISPKWTCIIVWHTNMWVPPRVNL